METYAGVLDKKKVVHFPRRLLACFSVIFSLALFEALAGFGRARGRLYFKGKFIILKCMMEMMIMITVERKNNFVLWMSLAHTRVTRRDNVELRGKASRKRENISRINISPTHERAAEGEKGIVEKEKIFLNCTHAHFSLVRVCEFHFWAWARPSSGQPSRFWEL